MYVETEEIQQSSMQNDGLLPQSNTSLLALIQSFAGSVPYNISSGREEQLTTSPCMQFRLPVTDWRVTQEVPPTQSPATSEMPPTQSPTFALIDEPPILSSFNANESFPLLSEEDLDDDDRSDDPLNFDSNGDDSASCSNFGDDDSDEGPEDQIQINRKEVPPFNERVMQFMEDTGTHDDDNIDNEDAVHIDMWSESENQIRLGMRFDSKSQLRRAITLWSVAQNREFRVVESRINTWVAKCKMVGENVHSDGDRQIYSPQCVWHVRAIHKKTHKKWQITRWVDGHNCLGFTSGNNNRNLNSSFIASHITHSIEVDPGYAVKKIQADIKKHLKVDVSYKKAWHGRRKAIEIVYGDWESNLADLPNYIAAMEKSNPNTIVRWRHHPNSTATVKIFKYIFWAFAPAIDAFHKCMPVVSIDGTHLRGSYKGKMLVAVVKDANNRLLPVAYAIVDEETVESWCWFLEQFRYFVAQDRSLCVISDRNGGIIHAMSNLDDWKEPYAYHRFCLRHIRSNFMTKFKNLTLKKLCWAIGSTNQKRKFLRCKREISAIDDDAWQWLKKIDKSQWSLAFDGNRRWGCLTTNMSESFNNVLRGARCLPIRACIDLTFHRTVQYFKEHSEMAINCNTPLPSHPWKRFIKTDKHAQGHHVKEFDYADGVYKIVTTRQLSGKGGNVQTVHYYRHTCTCGKWQMFRFPCSHAIAVCRYRGDPPINLVHEMYTTTTHRAQYSGKFIPLPHKDYWLNPTWVLQADYTRFIVHGPGRMRESRIEGEMDETYPDEPRRCGSCHQPGHNRRTCSNSRCRVVRDVYD